MGSIFINVDKEEINCLSREKKQHKNLPVFFSCNFFFCKTMCTFRTWTFSELHHFSLSLNVAYILNCTLLMLCFDCGIVQLNLFFVVVVDDEDEVVVTVAVAEDCRCFLLLALLTAVVTTNCHHRFDFILLFIVSCLRHSCH